MPNICCSYTTPRYLLKGKQSICPHEDLYMNGYSSLFVIANTWKALQCLPMYMWVDQQLVVYPYDDLHINNKNKWAIGTHDNIDESQNNSVEWKNQRKEYILYSIYQNFRRHLLIYSDRKWSEVTCRLRGREEYEGTKER